MKKSEWLIIGILIYFFIFYLAEVNESCYISDNLFKNTDTGYSLKFTYCEKTLIYLDPEINNRVYEHTSSFILFNDNNEFIKKIPDYQNIASNSEDNNPFEPKYIFPNGQIILNNNDIIIFKDDNIVKIGKNDSNQFKIDGLNSIYMNQTEMSAKNFNLKYNKNTFMDIFLSLSKFRIERIL